MYSIPDKVAQRSNRAFGLSGFTLTELMITVAIIGVLAALAAPTYGKFVVRAKVSDGLVLMSGRKPDIATFYSDNGTLPLSFTDIGWPSAVSKRRNRDSSEFEDIFGYKSDIWKSVELLRKKTGRGKNRVTNLVLVLRAYRKPAWDNVNLALNLQVKAENGVVQFRCVVGEKVKHTSLVPASCREGRVNQWNW